MKLYRCVYQMGVETALEYRANMVLTLLSTIFPIIIQTFLWNYLYGNGDAGAMTGYSYTEIIVYTLLAGRSWLLPGSNIRSTRTSRTAG